MARENISLARGIHCCPSSTYFFRPASLYCEKCVCVCVCVCVRARAYVCMCIYIYIYTHTHTQTPDCVEIVCKLPLLPNDTAAETFYTNRERCEVLTGH